jgi:hypothetical protein
MIRPDQESFWIFDFVVGAIDCHHIPIIPGRRIKAKSLFPIWIIVLCNYDEAF